MQNSSLSIPKYTPMNFIVIDVWFHRDGNYGHTSREGKASECVKSLNAG